MNEQPRVIRVAKLPAKKLTKKDAEQLLDTLCLYYPAYTFAAARKLPFKDVRRMVRNAKKKEAAFLHNLLQIVAAPHTKKGEAVKKLAEQFKDIMQHG